MTNWTFFTGLYDTLLTPIMSQLQGMLGTVAGAATPFALALAGVVVFLLLLDTANGTRSPGQLNKDVFAIVMLLALLQMQYYGQYIQSFFLQGMPNYAGTALGGTGSPVAAFDNVLNNAVVATMKTYEALPSWSLKTIPLGLVMLVFLVLDAICVAFSFAVYALNAATNVLVVAVGPLFLAAGVAPWGRFLLNGWFRVLVAGCVAQILTLATVTLMSNAEIAQLAQITAQTVGVDNNSIAMIWALAQALILIALCTALVKKSADIAHAIAGGVHHAAAAAASTFAPAGTAASAASGAAGKAAGAVGAHAGSQVGAGAVRAMAARPAGASLSAARP